MATSTTPPRARPGAGLRALPRRLLIGLVQVYRLFFKAWVGNACRFEPSCSAYALQALERHGALAGATLAAGRLLRCHPWCNGGCDPVPPAPPRLFTRLGLAGSAPAGAEPRPDSPPDPSACVATVPPPASKTP